MIELEKPLIPGLLIAVLQNSSLVQYKYERLSDYCYSCGRLGHLSFYCPVTPKLPDIGWFNDKLRANPMRDTRVEVLKPSSSLSTIFFFGGSSSSNSKLLSFRILTRNCVNPDTSSEFQSLTIPTRSHFLPQTLQFRSPAPSLFITFN
ncbi:hypothetical protein SLA2020_420670 [Shorea laevis]